MTVEYGQRGPDILVAGKVKVDDALIEAINDAIEKEQLAQVFYTKASGLAFTKDVKQFFRELKSDEVDHEKMLKAVLKDLRSGKLPMAKAKHIPSDSLKDSGLSRFLKKDIPKQTTDYQQALIIAMKREEEAWRGYNKLVKMGPPDALKDLFLLLAQVEAGHLRRLESIYERDILTGY